MIREITKQQAWQIRHEVMWPERELEYVQLADDDVGRHYGLFAADELLSVISLFVHHNEGQFRKFATRMAWQRQGHGSKLMAFIIAEAERHALRRLYCNARTEKAAFYERFGMHVTGESFRKGGKDYVIMERKWDDIV
ncbi:GNAT family N-acetyltransferase [Paenibacillus campi]|uniref:GNAT family N-acetyltransferase n=1 Tax=Paenibacillus campi TaxID=3106031 RepID=UPI002AFFADCC|nr:MULTISPECIES: GNAT family N-acetyltransferase [unclassified Paenibacillus]